LTLALPERMFHPMSFDPTVSLPLSMLDSMRDTMRQLEKDNAELRATAAQSAMGDGIGPVLAKGLRNALTIVQFTQANYDPETIRGWPAGELAELAKVFMELLPDATPHEKEWAQDTRSYIRFIETVERFRKEGRQQELAKIPRGSMAGGQYEAAANALLQQPVDQVADDQTNGA
jgi:hypothetical protein